MQRDGVFNYALMTKPALLFSADVGWFDPLPTDDIDIDSTQIMPLPSEDIYDEFFEDMWGELNKKDLMQFQ